MSDGVRRLQAYLDELRRRLEALPEEERDEIVAELRGHVLDSAGEQPAEEAVAAVLERLGPAVDLAAQYVTQSALIGAERSRAPWTLLRGLAHVAGVSLAGFSALVGCVVGYALAACFVLAALRKPMAPDRVGLWQLGPDSFSLVLGFGARPAGVELLGWWIVPIGLVAGAFGFWITTQLGRWCVRRLRRSPLLPAA
jgi:hypothetical protein